MNSWSEKKVLITGVCGTIGRELLRQMINNNPLEVIGLDNNESELFFISEEYRQNPRVKLYLGDIRDTEKLIRKMRGIDIVLHTAALKHVILCERSPTDAVQTNIIGTQNVIHAAAVNGVEKVIFTSSDKAVNPTNVMGTTKLMGERLMTAANAHLRGSGPVFSSTRFGNVLGSRGSVFEVFKRQIASGGPVLITDPRMTRFIMTIEAAVKLVMDSAFLAKGGEVYVTKMPVMAIPTLAQVMIDELAPKYGYKAEDIKINTIGAKAGEKYYEELLNDEETRRTVELERYFVILPAFKSVYKEIEYGFPATASGSVSNPYNSSIEKPMDGKAMRQFLIQSGLFKEEG